MKDPLRILLFEDSDADAKLIVRELRRSCGPIYSERVETKAAMTKALMSGAWDLMTCDWSMPEFSAIGAIELVRELELDVPVVIVSGSIGEEAAVEAMRAGARDYVLKDRLSRLSPVLEREIRETAARQARRAAEAALHASESRFAGLSESGIIGIAIADLSGNVVEANDTYLRWLGYDRADLRAGKVCWSNMIPADARQSSDRAGEQLSAHGIAPPWEGDYVRKDGSRATFLSAVAMLDHPNCIAILIDIAERKKAELALRNSEEQLRQSQKMEAIGNLAGGVAHDFNNLLTVVLSYSEMLMQDLQPNDPMRADLGEIKHAGERAAALTRQLLSFSRQQIIEPKILDLNEVLKNMNKLLRRLIREDISLVVMQGDALGRCKGDVGQIEQVVMNLVVNARDAMAAGGHLTLETANADVEEEYTHAHFGTKPGRYVTLSVSDNGVGMDRGTQARIFEPFFTTKDKGKGTGLGLSTVFGIVEQSGGSISVYSELGHGTTFKIYLPRTDEAPAMVPPPIVITTLRGTETILLVEDEDQIREVALGILERSGYRVIVASNPGEALLTCEQHQGAIDLLLTDVIMPQMSGRQLAERVCPGRPDMKVLFMSGYTDGIVVGRLAAGTAFLQKPLTPGMLTRKIREVLDSRAREQRQ